MPSSMCLCALCHVCVLKPRPCLSCHVLLQPFCSFYHIFLCFGLLVRTRSRPYRLCRRPNTEADIKGFGSPYFQVYACLLASMLYACVNLSCSRLCHAWGPPQAWSCLVTSDAHEALSGCYHLGCITMMPVASCIPFHFFLSVRWYACHACLCPHWLRLHLYMLVYMFMHESCLLVCRPCFNTMKLWAFDPNLHLSPMDTNFCLLACLFTCFSCLVGFPVCLLILLLVMFPTTCYALFVFLLVCLFICLHAFLLCSPCLSRWFALCLFHTLFAPFLSIACLLVSCLCLCMYTHRARTHGARAWFPCHKQKGRRRKHVDMSQAIVFNRFRV